MNFRATVLTTTAIAVLAVAPAAAWGSTQAEFAVKAQQIWVAAAPYYGQEPSSTMPSTRVVANRLGPRPRTVRLFDGTSQAWFTQKNPQGLLNGANASQEWLIHEWAHVFQSPGLKSWAGEGGPQAFARYVAPRIYRTLGMPFRQPWTRATDGYRRQMDRVERSCGWTWILHRQWGARK